jgi:hypothetical protein
MSSLATIIGRPCISNVFRPDESRRCFQQAELWADRTRSWLQMWTQRNTCDEEAASEAGTPWILGYGADRARDCDGNNGKTGRMLHQSPGRGWNDRETPHYGNFHYLVTSHCWILASQLTRWHDSRYYSCIVLPMSEKSLPKHHAFLNSRLCEESWRILAVSVGQIPSFNFLSLIRSILTDYMEDMPSWKADSCSASQEIAFSFLEQEESLFRSK